MIAIFDDASRDTDRIFRSERYLTDKHVPETPAVRDDEIETIAETLQPLTQNRTPDDLLVYGPSGTGKSTCVRHVFTELESQTRVKTVFINCWQYNTRPSLLTELLIQLGYPAPRKGKPVDALLTKVKEWLDKNRGVALALDEFDQYNAQTETVYDLQTLSKRAANDIGLIMISNKLPSQLHLDPRSQSRLSFRTLEFSRYDEAQLRAIIEQRVERAFKPNTVSEAVIDAVVEEAAQDGGDCRRALELLRRSGRLAERRDHSEIDVELVSEASD